MKIKFIPLALAVGVLAAIWTYLSVTYHISTWAAFVGWAFFFVAGGGAQAILKVAVPSVVGVVLGYLALYGLKLQGQPVVGVALAVGLAALIMVVLMNWAPFELAPAGFAAFAVFFADVFGGFLKGADMYSLNNVLFSLLALFIGIGLGWVSTSIPTMFSKPAPKPVAQP